MNNLRKQLDKIGSKAASELHSKFLKSLSPFGWEDTTYRNDTNISIGYGEPDYDKFKIWFVPITDDEGNSIEVDNFLNSKIVKDAFDDADDFYFGKNNVFDKREINAEDFNDIMQTLEEIDEEFTKNKNFDKVISALQKTVKYGAKTLFVDEDGSEVETDDLSNLSSRQLPKWVNDYTGYAEESNSYIKSLVTESKKFI